MTDHGVQQDALHPEEILRRLPARRRLARRLELAAGTASTNQDARAALAAGDAAQWDGALFVAETQSAGKGRRERDWWSGPAGSGLALSLVVVPPPQPPEALGLIGACALAEALRPWVRAPLALKWPNDVLLGGAKVAGFLAELPSPPPGGPLAAVLGMGVNVHAVPPSEVAPYPVSAVAAAARRRPCRGRILVQWILGVEKRLARLERRGPGQLEREMLRLLRAWAPHGVRPKPGAGKNAGQRAAEGPLLEFAVSEGLTWGPEAAPETRPLGLVPELEALPGTP